MPQFSTFGIYEKEIRTFIDKIATCTPIDKQELTAWIYFEGMMANVLAQKNSHESYEAQFIKEFGRRPLISTNHSLGQHSVGLAATLEAMVKKFGELDPEQSIPQTFYCLVASKTTTTHKPFIAIEAEVHSELNNYLDAVGKLEPSSILKKTIELFEKRRGQHPALEEDFKYKLILMNEYLAMIPKPAVTSVGMFKPEPAASAQGATIVPQSGL